MLGGNDTIFGGDNLLGDQILVGGVYDDNIFAGDDIDGDIKVYGDNISSTPLVEDNQAYNLNDGNDIITIGNNNVDVSAFGQGGNDKIVGGWGLT